MSENVPVWFARQYATNIALLLQQMGTKLRGTVSEAPYVGDQASPVDQVGPVTARKVTSRFGPMGRVDAPTDRRWVFPTDYDLPQLLDSFDKLRMLTDPESSYVINGMYAMGRAMDDELIAAFFADAMTGNQGGTTTSFPAGQVVDVDLGAAAATGLNVAKLRATKKLFMENEVDLDREQIHFGITADQHDNLLNEIQIVSTDFNDRPVLVDGRVTQFLGIRFIPCERYDTDSNSYRRCPAWVPSGMHLGIWNDLHTSISTRNDLQGEPWQAYAKETIGATRIEEKRVVEVKCSE